MTPEYKDMIWKRIRSFMVKNKSLFPALKNIKNPKLVYGAIDFQLGVVSTFERNYNDLMRYWWFFDNDTRDKIPDILLKSVTTIYLTPFPTNEEVKAYQKALKK